MVPCSNWVSNVLLPSCFHEEGLSKDDKNRARYRGTAGSSSEVHFSVSDWMEVVYILVCSPSLESQPSGSVRNMYLRVCGHRVVCFSCHTRKFENCLKNLSAALWQLMLLVSVNIALCPSLSLTLSPPEHDFASSACFKCPRSMRVQIEQLFCHLLPLVSHS